ncbi:alpha/beta fold hydrolase BchO [Polynucleobacter sp. UB-Siik-W21]|jgi:magnesium chelatase accessory protein|uniref:alpha/beta fold hydrolase BchO n=1 Tax=Polynucleobacter sp. UB-Siik-W21 TaxID=1855646 RepID=UPI001BFD2F9B|nr:alpha/beta fold hydrolase BchO [Polynucleobacter sp. UB-Siik-W21]QWD69857.1 alpha/beta fold hydrolase [Polynucleobacter sp. UB-Siik-W21]
MKRIPLDWPNRQHSSTVSVGGLDWHVQLTGKGPVVLLLHGTGSSTHSWSDLIPLLEAHAQVLVPDLPGHAFTLGAKLEDLTLDEIANSLQLLIEQLGIEAPSIVVGHSAGAPLALRFAVGSSKPPKLVIALNPSFIPPPAVYTSFFGPLLGPITRSSTLSSLLASLSPSLGMVDKLLDSTNTILPETRRVYYRKLFERSEHVRGSMNFMAAADIHKVLVEANLYRGKLICVLGNQDAWIPVKPLEKIILDYFPAAEIVKWEGGHIMHELEPNKVAQLILEGLKTEFGD